MKSKNNTQNSIKMPQNLGAVHTHTHTHVVL